MPTPLTLREYSPRLEDACDDLRHIRSVLDRSTRYSTLSGLSGILVGLWAIGGVLATRFYVSGGAPAGAVPAGRLSVFAAIWLGVLALSAGTDYLLTKRRAVAVGKRLFSPLGARIAQAIAPSFFAGLAISLSLLARHEVGQVWALWMIAYGLAGCAVGLFSVRPVSVLGWAFVAAGAVTLFLPPSVDLWMMAASFGGFHIAYGLFTGLTRGGLVSAMAIAERYNPLSQNLDALDETIHQKVRLGIMSALMAQGEGDFRFLKETLGVTDGNLSIHLARLEEAGYIGVRKEFVGRKPRTTYTPTEQGKGAFHAYLAVLERIVQSATRGQSGA